MPPPPQPLPPGQKETDLATHFDGKPLVPAHGAPLRVVVPHLYAWKSAKFVRKIEFLTENVLGYWERRGYSDSADPWTEDRYR